MDFTRGNTPGIGSALAPSPELLLRRADLRAGLRRGFARLSARIIASSSLSTSKSVPNELPRASDERLLRLLQLRPRHALLLARLGHAAPLRRARTSTGANHLQLSILFGIKHIFLL